MNKSEVLEKIISMRRSVKPDRFTGEVVTDALVWNLLEAANWAPNHGNTEPWRFVVFSGEKKALLLDFLNQLDAELNGANEIRDEKRAKSFEVTSHLIAIVMKRGENPKIPELEELLATAMAVQNMWLTAHAMGLGGYWSTGNLAFSKKLTAFLGFNPEVDRALGFFYLGKPIDGAPAGRRLSQIEEKVRWV